MEEANPSGPLPVCPSCGAHIGLRDSFSFWNPWNYPCPHCKVRLESSMPLKVVTLALVPAGTVLAAAAIYLQRNSQKWGLQTWLLLGVGVAVLIAGAVFAWRHTRFAAKPGP